MKSSTKILRLAVSALAAVILLGACSGQQDGAYPSLAKRPIEDAAPVSSSPPPALASSLPADLSARLSMLESRMTRAGAEFASRLPRVEARANSARNASRNSEAWVAAHVEITRLDQSRADGVAAMAELDELILRQLDAELAGTSPRYAHLLKDRQQALAAAITAQAAEIDRLARIVGM